MSRVLVWCAGDVSAYERVRYVYEGFEPIRTFLAPAALNSWFKYDLRVCFVPETLFEEGHEEGYLLLLKGKAEAFEDGYVYQAYRGGRLLSEGDDPVRKLLSEKPICLRVPHGGIARPLRVDVEVDVEHKVKKIHIRSGDVRTFKRDFNVTFNYIYKHMLDIVREVKPVEMHVDLTHGTNVMVTALMLASQIISVVYDVKVRYWSAPILGRPERDMIVRFLDVTQAYDIASKVHAGAIAWKNIDERILPVEDFAKLGKDLGAKYGSEYGNVKTILTKSRDILWYLRSGQGGILLDEIKKLKKCIEEYSGYFSKLVNREYPRKKLPKKEGDIPWIPLVDAVLTLCRKHIVDELYPSREGDNYSFIVNVLKLYNEVEYYDKAICLGREWLISLILREKLLGRGIKKIKVGEGEWERLNTALAKPEESLCEEDKQILKEYGIDELDRIDDEILNGIKKNILHRNALIPNTSLLLNAQNLLDFSTDFNEVLNNGGFNVIFSNPPYYLLKVNNKKSPLLNGYYTNLKNKIKSEIKFFKTSGVYNYAIEGMLNYYQLSIEMILKLTKKNGEIGIICPSSIFADLTTSRIRKFLLNNNTLRFIRYYPETSNLFDNVAQSTVIFYLKNV